MYAALPTRPDISYAVAAPCRYNSRPFTGHLTAAKRVLQYLKATAYFRLHFNGNGNGNGSGNGNDDVVGCTDSAWASDSNDRKSRGGHVILTCHDGSAISWQSRKHDLIALSTLEAEYIACSEAFQTASWLLQLWRYSRLSERRIPATDLLRQSWCPHTYRYWSDQGQNEAHRCSLP